MDYRDPHPTITVTADTFGYPDGLNRLERTALRRRRSSDRCSWLLPGLLTS